MHFKNSLENLFENVDVFCEMNSNIFNRLILGYFFQNNFQSTVLFIPWSGQIFSMYRAVSAAFGKHFLAF